MAYINEWNHADFSQHLKSITGNDEKVVEAKIAGDGNMNFTYRLKFQSGRSIIIKQSPAFCAKFPSIPASQLLKKESFQKKLILN